MCGIAGYLNIAEPGADRTTLARFAAALVHRGPDGEGVFTDGPVGLVHRRLAIIDLSPTGAQPLTVDRYTVVLNGEIYNYRELRDELRRAGEVFCGESDTEVLVRGFRVWGPGVVHRLRGMWAFAIAERGTGRLIVGRDPFGIKPFYYATHRGAYLFASEPTALLAAGVPARANEQRLAEYIGVGICDHTAETFFAGIRQLEPGLLCEIDSTGSARVLERVTYEPAAGAAPSTLEDFADAVRGSVAIHLRSDVPVGTCLSGGLDSSTVAALASGPYRADTGQPFAAVTAGCADPVRDERPLAAVVVKRLGLDWHTVAPDAATFAGEVDDCIRAQGEPVLSPSAYYQYCVMRAARAAGLKVMLDGQGSDELVGGYERYVPLWVRDLATTRGGLSAARAFVRTARGTKPGVRGMLALAAYYWVPALRQRALAGRLEFLNENAAGAVRGFVERMTESYASFDGARRGDLDHYTLPALLRCEDRNSMAHSVEARVPYVDLEVAERALRLPLDVLFRDGYSKYPVRRLADSLLPASIVWRKSKIGFEPPLDYWLAAIHDRATAAVGASPLLARLCRHPPVYAQLPLALRWRLYNVAAWERIFGVATV